MASQSRQGNPSMLVGEGEGESGQPESAQPRPQLSQMPEEAASATLPAPAPSGGEDTRVLETPAAAQPIPPPPGQPVELLATEGPHSSLAPIGAMPSSYQAAPATGEQSCAADASADAVPQLRVRPPSIKTTPVVQKSSAQEQNTLYLRSQLHSHSMSSDGGVSTCADSGGGSVSRDPSIQLLSPSSFLADPGSRPDLLAGAAPVALPPGSDMRPAQDPVKEREPSSRSQVSQFKGAESSQAAVGAGQGPAYPQGLTRDPSVVTPECGDPSDVLTRDPSLYMELDQPEEPKGGGELELGQRPDAMRLPAHADFISPMSTQPLSLPLSVSQVCSIVRMAVTCWVTG